MTTVRAAAKINLNLGVGPLRSDGFHELNTTYLAVSLYDDITVTAAESWSVAITSVGAIEATEVPSDERNIAIKAGKLLLAHHRIQGAAHIEIAKGIPVAGGMAGGSADAAAALVAIDRLFELGSSDQELLDLAAQLGSDVPFALLGGLAHGTGHGEVVSSLPISQDYWVVVLPNPVGLATPEVYAEFDRLGQVRHDWKVANTSGIGVNDLQAAALSLRPDLAADLVLLAESGAEQVLLSGSGPTLLGFVSDRAGADRLRAKLAELAKTAFVVTGPVAGAHQVVM